MGSAVLTAIKDREELEHKDPIPNLSQVRPL